MRALLLFGLLNALDAGSTALALSLPGFREGNGLAASLGGGMWLLKAVSTVTVIAVVAALGMPYVTRRVMLFGNGFLSMVVLGNVAQLALFVVC